MLDLFPDQSPEYVRRVLALPAYSNNAERVIEGILDGTVPSADSLPDDIDLPPSAQIDDQYEELEYTKDRHNIFDGDEMKVENLTYGKR